MHPVLLHYTVQDDCYCGVCVLVCSCNSYLGTSGGCRCNGDALVSDQYKRKPRVLVQDYDASLVHVTQQLIQAVRKQMAGGTCFNKTTAVVLVPGMYSSCWHTQQCFSFNQVKATGSSSSSRMCSP